MKIIFFLLILATIYNTLIIPILPSVTILVILFTLKYKEINTLYLLIIFLVCFMFYNISFVDKSMQTPTESVFFLSSYKASIIVFFEYIIKNIVVYLPTFFVFLVYFFKKRSSLKLILKDILFLYFIISILSSLVFSSVFHGTINFNQAFYNFIPSVVLIFLLYLSLQINSVVLIIIFSIFSIFNIFEIKKSYLNYNKYSERIISKNKRLLINSKYLIYNKKCNDWKYCFNELGQYNSQISNISSGFNIYNDLLNNQKATNSPFENWCIKKCVSVNFDSLLMFMREFEIKFLLVDNQNTLSRKMLLNFKIINIDSYSNEVLLSIK